ncbi:MAG: hypothetical protein JNM17_22630 [Archangium sp.]|nr:hypothetical protein [Archangium sp.]
MHGRVWLVLLVFLSACPPSADQLVFRLPDGSKAKNAAFDFGGRGATTMRTVYLVNESMQEVAVGDAALDGTFNATLAATKLAKGAEVAIAITYVPSSQDSATFTVNSPSGTALATLALTGRYEGSQCALIDTVDFGAILIGESLIKSVDFPVQETRRDVFVGAPAAPFQFPATMAPSGTQDVGGGEAFTARVQLPARTAAIELNGTWRLDPGGGCAPKDVALRASVLEHFLSASPVDFGAVAAPAQPSANATLLNALSRPVTVTLELQSSSGGPTTNFRSGLTQVELPAATRDPAGNWRPGEAEVPLSAWLLGAGTVQGKLIATTAGANGADEVLEVPLVARGAGAGIAVHPGPLELQVPRIGMETLPVATGVVVVNEDRNPMGATVNVSSITIEASAGTQLADLCLGAFANGTCTAPAAFALAPGAEKQLPIRIAPTSGNGPWRWVLVLHTDDMLVPEVRVEVRGQLRPQSECVLQQPQALKFGPVRAPTPLVQALVLENQSLSPCFVQGLWIDGSTDFHAPSSFTVQPGERKLIDVEYLPTTAPGMSVFPQLRYSVNASSAPIRSIPLEASSDDGCLFLFPEQFDFGSAGPSCGPRVQSFGVGNRCATGDVTFAGARLTGNGAFTFEGTPMGNRVMAQTFVPDAVRVRFDPTMEGTFAGALELDVMIPAGGTKALLAPLRGAATTTGRQRDRFVMPTSADALLVQDMTSTMDPLWAGLSGQAQAFIDAATNRARSVRVGAMDADAATARLRDVGGSSWVELELSPVSPLSAMLGGAPSTAAEAFRSPVLTALTGANVTAGGMNRGFLRRGASFNVMVASDARDQSSTPVSVALPQLSAIKGSHRPELLSWSHVGPLAAMPPSGCMYDDPVMNAGDEVAAVAMTGGASLEVCSAKMTPSLITTQVLPTLFGDRDTLPLRAPIAPGSVPVVTVGGVGVPEMSPQGGRNWAYDVTRKAVTFSGLTLRSGEIVEFDYPTLCSP